MKHVKSFLLFLVAASALCTVPVQAYDNTNPSQTFSSGTFFVIGAACSVTTAVAVLLSNSCKVKSIKESRQYLELAENASFLIKADAPDRMVPQAGINDLTAVDTARFKRSAIDFIFDDQLTANIREQRSVLAQLHNTQNQQLKILHGNNYVNDHQWAAARGSAVELQEKLRQNLNSAHNYHWGNIQIPERASYLELCCIAAGLYKPSMATIFKRPTSLFNDTQSPESDKHAHNEIYRLLAAKAQHSLEMERLRSTDNNSLLRRSINFLKPF